MTRIILLFSLSAFSAFNTCLGASGSLVHDSEKETAPITIVLHGTTRTTNSIEFIPFLYDALAQQMRTPKGFLSIDQLSSKNRFYKLAQAISQADPVNFPFKDFFFFGWSGKLSRTARKIAAQELYYHIKKLKQNPKYKNRPIRIITHSHGGNVILSMAMYLEELSHYHHKDIFVIDEFIPLACPVQDITEKYLNSPLFKNIINIYTTSDFIQIIDPHGLYDDEATTLFSRRVFKQLHTNLIQVCVKLNRRSLSHLSFIESWFWQILPEIIKQAVKSNTKTGQPVIIDARPLIKKQKN